MDRKNSDHWRANYRSQGTPKIKVDATLGCDSFDTGVQTIDDIIASLHQHNKPHSIDVIVISGHGNGLGGVQSGAGGIGPGSGGQSGATNPAGMTETQAAELGRYLTEGGVVIIAACGAGSSPEELQNWANFIGHPVIATPGDVNNGVESTQPWITVNPQFQDY